MDLMYALGALVPSQVRGLDVGLKFALGAFGANGNEQISWLMDS